MNRVTAAEVARAAGVSRATVGFVLNSTPGQSISAEVKERVLSEASRLGYSPHPQARALASGQSHIILALLPEFPVEYLLRQLLDEAAHTLDEAGYSLVTMDPHASGHARPLWETLRPDAVIPVQPLAPARASAIRRSGARLVLPEEGGHLAFEVGPEIQVDHLAARGHTRIAYASTHVNGMEEMNAGRLARVSDLVQHRHLTLRSAVIDERTAQQVVAEWLADGVTGVVAFNDDTAAEVVGAAIRLGAAVPTDLAVIGHDDSPIASKMVPSLSTVHFDIAGLGRHFALHALAAARDEPLPPFSPPDVRAHVVHRESS